MPPKTGKLAARKAAPSGDDSYLEHLDLSSTQQSLNPKTPHSRCVPLHWSLEHPCSCIHSVVSWCEHYLLMCVWILYGLLRSELKIFRLEFQGPQSGGTSLFHGKSGG